MLTISVLEKTITNFFTACGCTEDAGACIVTVHCIRDQVRGKQRICFVYARASLTCDLNVYLFF
jgi:hypothetical protein